ncbi:hypothetical protein STEG23_029223 [Scotinomys teguina]
MGGLAFLQMDFTDIKCFDYYVGFEYHLVTVILQHIINNITLKCSLTETSCFWRIKDNEEDDVDLRSVCEFVLFVYPEESKKEFYNRIVDFKVKGTLSPILLIQLDIYKLKEEAECSTPLDICTIFSLSILQLKDI